MRCNGTEGLYGGEVEFYTDPVSPATLFDFFTGIWRTGDIRWPIKEDAGIHYFPYKNMSRNNKAHPIVLSLISANELQISRPVRRSDIISLPIIA
jgi:hypothetical protein